jgi:hypothetical protein
MANPINIYSFTVADADVVIGLNGQPGVRLTNPQGEQIVLLADAAARTAVREAIDKLETAFEPPQGHG